jgi:hypothetical protein
MSGQGNDKKPNNVINLHEQKRLRRERGQIGKQKLPWENRKANPVGFWPILQLILFVGFLAFAIRNCH